MANLTERHEVEELLYREAYCLDTRDWDRWLDLYTDDLEFWMPAWVSEDTLATDPELELALIHCQGRDDLADRIFRIRTEDSLASSPMPRSVHVCGNVLILEQSEHQVQASAAWTVHMYTAAKGARAHGGRYEYTLRRCAEGLRIAKKKVIFINDGVDVPLDIYNV